MVGIGANELIQDRTLAIKAAAPLVNRGPIAHRVSVRARLDGTAQGYRPPAVTSVGARGRAHYGASDEVTVEVLPPGFGYVTQLNESFLTVY